VDIIKNKEYHSIFFGLIKGFKRFLGINSKTFTLALISYQNRNFIFKPSF